MNLYLWLAGATPAPDGTTGQGGGMIEMMLLMGAVFVVFYLLIIRPQRKKERERQQKREHMLAALQKNDKVMTIGGLHGVVASVSDDAVVIKIDEKNDVRVKVTRDAVSRVVGGENEDEEPKKLGEE